MKIPRHFLIFNGSNICAELETMDRIGILLWYYVSLLLILLCKYWIGRGLLRWPVVPPKVRCASFRLNLFVVDRWSGAELSYPNVYHMTSVRSRTRRKALSELWRQC